LYNIADQKPRTRHHCCLTNYCCLLQKPNHDAHLKHYSFHMTSGWLSTTQTPLTFADFVHSKNDIMPTRCANPQRRRNCCCFVDVDRYKKNQNCQLLSSHTIIKTAHHSHRLLINHIYTSCTLKPNKKSKEQHTKLAPFTPFHNTDSQLNSRFAKLHAKAELLFNRLLIFIAPFAAQIAFVVLCFFTSHQTTICFAVRVAHNRRIDSLIITRHGSQTAQTIVVANII